MKNIIRKHFLTSFVAGLATASLCLTSMPASAEVDKDTFYPTIEAAPILLMKDSILSNILGRNQHGALNVWVGEYFEFDDNMFGTSKDKKSDTLFNTVAGFRLKTEDPDVWRVDISGQLRYKAYGQRDEYNGFEGYFHSNGSMDFSPALTARFNANYDNTYDNIRDVQDIYAMHRYSAGLGVTLRPSPYAGVDVDAMFSAQRRDVHTLRSQNYNEYSVSVRPYYALSPHATVYVQASGSITRPLEAIYNDSTSVSTSVGLSWAYNEYTNLSFQVGYKYAYYDNNGTITDTKRHDSGITANVSGSWSFAQNWTLGGGVSYAPTYGALSSNANQSNSIDTLRGNLYLDYTPENNHFNARLGTHYSYNDPSNNDKYSDYGATLGVGYAFTEWLSVNAGYTIGFTKYEGQAEYTHNTITIGCTATF